MLTKIRKGAGFRRAATVSVLSVLGVGALVSPSFATSTDPATVLGTAATSLSTTLLEVGAAVAVAAISIVALRKGWRLMHSFFGR